jgi:hypothetical protein
MFVLIVTMTHCHVALGHNVLLREGVKVIVTEATVTAIN